MENNSVEITVEQATKLREGAKERIALAQAMDRLHDNSDFQLLFKTYTESESIRLTGLLADPSINMGNKKEMFREDIIENLNATARFKYYCNTTIYQLAQQAEKLLEDLDKASIN